jgi:hypothetical protein
MDQGAVISTNTITDTGIRMTIKEMHRSMNPENM